MSKENIRVHRSSDVISKRDLKPHWTFAAPVQYTGSSYSYYSAAIGNRFIAAISLDRCFLRELKSDQIWQPVCSEVQDLHGWSNNCIALVEVGESIVIALGLKKNHRGWVKVFTVAAANFRDEKRIGNFQVFAQDDRPKMLKFSDDGRYLVCATAAYNQLRVWRIDDGGGNDTTMTQICATSRPFTAVSCRVNRDKFSVPKTNSQIGEQC